MLSDEGPLACRTRRQQWLVDIVWFSVGTAPVSSVLRFPSIKKQTSVLKDEPWCQYSILNVAINKYSKYKTSNYHIIMHITHNKNDTILTINNELYSTTDYWPLFSSFSRLLTVASVIQHEVILCNQFSSLI
jgi:hypothetical protein